MFRTNSHSSFDFNFFFAFNLWELYAQGYKNNNINSHYIVYYSAVVMTNSLQEFNRFSAKRLQNIPYPNLFVPKRFVR